MTKRTISRAFAAGLAALLLTGCGDGRGAAGPKPATQCIADVAATPTPGDPVAATHEPAAGPAPAPHRIVRKTVTETTSIGYSTRRVKDGSLAKGKTKTRIKGKAGVRTLTYTVTVTDGKQTAKKLVKSVVTRAPVTKVVAVGTKQQSGGCDPNYSGACVPIASDVDCAGGSGNGPAYVTGPVRVVGTDIYRLDRDGDGVACDD